MRIIKPLQGAGIGLLSAAGAIVAFTFATLASQSLSVNTTFNILGYLFTTPGGWAIMGTIGAVGVATGTGIGTYLAVRDNRLEEASIPIENTPLMPRSKPPEISVTQQLVTNGLPSNQGLYKSRYQDSDQNGNDQTETKRNEYGA